MITAFFHVAGMNHWREIVAEQLRVLGAARFPGTIHVHYAGPQDQQWYIQRVADIYALPVEFLENRPLDHFEFPTIAAAQEYAATCDPATNILYFHTKGVSCPNSWNHTLWRWMMNAHMLTEWEKAEKALLEVDGGRDWVATQVFSPNIPHSSGNFWLATSAHLRNLEPLEKYHRSFMDRYRGRMPWGWNQRHANEGWIGSDEQHRYYQLMTIPVIMWDAGSWIRHVDAQTFATRHGQ